ncbi:unnamed protein product, partial [Vitis vinifera]|uniref:Uncharacterized protein n=1 Tax=Vitis vinifera TaxID=29760 RepID=D7SZA5_VITVI
MFMPLPRLERSTSTIDLLLLRPRMMEYVCIMCSKSSHLLRVWRTLSPSHCRCCFPSISTTSKLVIRVFLGLDQTMNLGMQRGRI